MPIEKFDIAILQMPYFKKYNSEKLETLAADKSILSRLSGENEKKKTFILCFRRYFSFFFSILSDILESITAITAIGLKLY